MLAEQPSLFEMNCAQNNVDGAQAAITKNPPGLGMRRIAFETACEKKAADSLRLIATLANVTDDERRDFLHEAARRGFTLGVAALLDAGVDVNSRDTYGQPALTGASVEGSLDTVELLLSRGADRTLQTNSGNTAAKLAAAFKKHAIVERLERP